MNDTHPNNHEHRMYMGPVFGRFTAHVIRRRWLWLAVVALVTAFFIVQMSKVRFDNSSEIWFVEGHQALLNKAVFDETFGNDEYGLVLFLKEETPFTPDNLRAMTELARALETDVPYARKVTWLGNVENIHSNEDGGDEVVVEDYIHPVPDDQAAIDDLLARALEDPLYVDNLISRDGTTLLMLIELSPYPLDKNKDVNPRNTVSQAMQDIVARPAFKNLVPHLAGSPVFSHEYEKLVQGETGQQFSIIVIVQILLLLWLGRGLRGVVTPLGVTIVSVFWTVGSMGLLDITANLLTIALPTMLICVGIGDSMHGIAAFHNQVDKGTPRKEALRKAFTEVGGAVMLTSLTTAIGFLAYLTTHVKPYREMGVYVALGVIYAFVLTLILVPALYSFGKAHPRPRKSRLGGKGSGDIFDRWLSMTHRIVTTRTKTVAAIFVVIMAVTFAGFLMMKVESNSAKLIFKRIPLRQTLDMFDERLGTGNNLEFLIDTGRPDGVKDPAFMKKLDQLQGYAQAHPLVTKATSVTHVIKKVRQALHGNDPAFYALPDSNRAMAQYLFLYESSGGDELDRQVGFTYDVIRLSLKTKYLDTGQGRQLSEDMLAKTREMFGPDVRLVESGSISRYLALNDILFEGQRNSFIAALTVITLVMMLVLRSVRLGLISLAPNVLPVFLTMGFMGLTGFYLDVITISFAAVIIGVAVDDTIHFFTRFREEFVRVGNYSGALKLALKSTGRPITFTSMVLILGNAVFLTSGILGFFKLGLLFGVAFATALIADLYFATALILIFKPLGPERAPQPDGDSHA